MRARAYVAFYLSWLIVTHAFISDLVEGADAPDIVANTFLSQVTDEQLEAVGHGFLSHRESESICECPY